MDKGFADIVTLEGDVEKRKINATVINLSIDLAKAFDVDRVMFGAVEFVVLRPSDIKNLIIKNIRLYLVEKIWSLTLLEMIK